jgi:type I restriction enzyme R subunit
VVALTEWIMDMQHSSNFEFLKEYDPIFFKLTHNAERIFAIDPNACVVKFRQFGEALAKDIAARAGIRVEKQDKQTDLLRKIRNQLDLDREVMDLFHDLRISGNAATHEFETKFGQAMDGLRSARTLAIWFHRTFGKNGDKFKPGAFKLPEDPAKNLRKLQSEISKLKTQLESTEQSLDDNAQMNGLISQVNQEKQDLEEQASAAKVQLEKQLSAAQDDAQTYEELLSLQDKEIEKTKKDYDKKFAALKAEAEASKKDLAALKAIKQATRKATAKIDLSEEETRKHIDRQLRDAGWQVDSKVLKYSNGTRPQKGKNIAIAEWPTKGEKRSKPADYVLFVGMTPVGIVEAKKQIIEVARHLSQANRYALNFLDAPEFTPAWQIEGLGDPWKPDSKNSYQVPFIFAANGRPYVKQFEQQSGTWYRDVRKASNLAEALHGFLSPAGLIDKLTRSKKEAQDKLAKEGFSYLKLYDFQEKAVKAVELALANGHKRALLAMATGTGKTRTMLGMMYRFLETERFKRVLFLVDRTSLGDQAFGTFQDVKIKEGKSLTQIYNVAELGDKRADKSTRLHVATVQAMVSRIGNLDNPISIDEYDCIVVDEAHRGYTLDKEMTEGEAEVRDASQYLSGYRRVLEYFDAFKVGLTATPALHTTEIFGNPVFTYSYREAVAEDRLVDHEPPHIIETKLNTEGIHFDKGETVSVLNKATNQVEMAELPDELDLDVDSFNRSVLSEGFNETIAEAFAQYVDPMGQEKSMVFAVNKSHAATLKAKLDEAFKEVYGESYNSAAVEIIVGDTDEVGKAISRYKNERFPSVAITVDLLTTGIDVRSICHLLFVRRVKSRILYEQMVGRATRLCPEIGKTEFHIYDAVNIYKTLEKVSTMKPLVKDPNVTLEQLIHELDDEKSHTAPGSQEGTQHAHDVLDQISQKIMRTMRKAVVKADKNPELKEKLFELQQQWEVEPEKLHQHVRKLGPVKAKEFLQKHSRLVQQLEQVKYLIGTSDKPIIHTGKDEIREIRQGYGLHEKPDDYLTSFNDFIKQQISEVAALKVICTQPKNITRQDLKDIKLLLDNNGFSETTLKTAWRNKTNHEIAASIIGYIRQAALGEALIPFEDRVANAMQTIYGLQNWTPVQRKTLDNLASQLVYEVIIDAATINDIFSDEGGYKGLNRRLANQLDNVVEAINDHLWPAAANA